MNAATKTPKPKASAIYNPDAKISAEQRKKNAEATHARGLSKFADAVRSFSPWELEELRMDMLSLPTLRAERFTTLIDEHQAAADFRDAVAAALDGVDLEGLKDAVSGAEDNLHAELSSKDDEINELLQDRPELTPAELVTAFRLWHDKEITRLKSEITTEISKLTDAVEAARDALAVLGD
jgi:hypothetical protein